MLLEAFDLGRLPLHGQAGGGDRVGVVRLGQAEDDHADDERDGHGEPGGEPAPGDAGEHETSDALTMVAEDSRLSSILISEIIGAGSMLQPGTGRQGKRRDVAAHGMYRRRDDPRGRMVAEITNDLRRYSVDAQHIGHAFAEPARAQPHRPARPDRGHGRRAASATRSPPAGSANTLNLSSGSVTALIDRLERAGHIRRDRDTADRRKVLLHYADQGAALAMEFFRPARAPYRRGDGPLQRRRAGRGAAVHGGDGDSMRAHRDEVRAARPEPPRRPTG